MIDSRLRQVAALLDEARTLLVELVDSRTVDADLRDFNNIDAARQFINSAGTYVLAADSTQAIPDQPA